MSYYYRRRYRSNYSRTSNYYSEVEKKPKKAFDITSYIKDEFFNADDITFSRIANLYKQLYGYGAYKYMMDTFYSWKSGSVGLSGQTMYRILECVPKFLTDEKRFYILKCEIVYFIEVLHSKQQNKSISLSQINTLFENYAQEINNFNEVNLSWFVGKGIFNQNEINQFLSVCKYALSQKLRLTYRQTFNDIALVKQKLSTLRTGIFDCKYQIDFLNSKVDLSLVNESSVNPIELTSQRTKLEGTFKDFAEMYIMEELMKMDFAEKEGQVNGFIKSKDLDFFIDKYNEISAKEQQASLRSEFKGEGGLLYLSLEAKSFKKIKRLIFTTASKLLLFVGLFIVAIFLIFQFKLYQIGVLIFWGGLIGSGIFVSAISNEIKMLKKLNLDLKLYGK